MVTVMAALLDLLDYDWRFVATGHQESRPTSCIWPPGVLADLFFRRGAITAISRQICPESR
jgi:hypothetical protein